MRINRLAFQITALLSVLCSCSTDTTADNNLKELSINIDNAIETGNALRTSKEIEISSGDMKSPGITTSVVMRNDTMFVLDDLSNKGVYVYNTQGKQLFYFNNIGVGEKQLNSVNDFHVGNKYIYIGDHSGKMARITMKGKFKDSKKIELLPNHFFVDEKENVVYGDNNNEPSKGRTHSLMCYRDGQLASKLIPITPERKYLNATCAPTFYKVGKEIHYFTGLRDTIFSISTEKATPIYHLNFGKLWPSEKFLKDTKNNIVEFYSKMNKDGLALFVRYFENENLLALTFSIKDNKYTYIYNKTTDKQTSIIFHKELSLSGLDNDRVITSEKSNGKIIIRECDINWQ